MEQDPQSRTKLPFSLRICGVDELPRVMDRFIPTHVISITDPDDEPLDFPEPVSVLRLTFLDIHSPAGMVGRMLMARGDDGFPSIDHADAILRFGRELPEKAKVLVHCWAGHSRSPAEAFLLAAQVMVGAERRAYDLIRVLRPHCRPNTMLVQFGDKLLGAGGRMVSCL